jgi:creatinine amidohydrolase/Fe(II)-dependent formamide hydrolase-like protein
MPKKATPANRKEIPIRPSAQAADPLDVLQAIDRLEVGPVRLEPKRLVATYKVIRDGEADTMELIYKYAEEVFAPAEAASRNLANMIAAQVALNYGLFCRKIVFYGDFDAADRNLLLDMAVNTAREIYVKKFLEPNPFLTESVAHLPIVQKRSYLQAQLEFPDADATTKSIRWDPGPIQENRIAISSSGGKDSLLSFGLLREIGFEVHPIFGNESGRHWFTALNAYRYFEQNIPGTARVWMNSDRIFAWMLRHLPFIRSDFANLRSDEYPVRLWTVAVFLFGALPLMRKRGIGRFVIGDEFDTTTRASHRGISHYDGLFDQSRYFDNMLSRYYSRKGWPLSQFSIVRPLSELLIEKILVQRYADLFALQMSCHATHLEDDRVRPCGKCEKCRRIVGMVLANDGDPAVCGYDQKQVNDCLIELAQARLHQERAGREQLMWMLRRKGKLPPNVQLVSQAREHPEILKLRFDRERAPVDGIPKSIREPLYSLFLEYANGAVLRQGKTWLDFDVLNDPTMHSPYFFEKSGRRVSLDQKKTDAAPNRHILAEMTWPEAKRIFKEVDIALLPVGSIEQHGPHLPLDTDAFDADYLAKSVALGCTDPRPIVLPLVPYGVSYHHDDFSGTMSISNETLARLVFEIGLSAARNGITKLVIINAHGGNTPALNFAAQEINRSARIFVCVDTGETSDVDINSMIDTPNDVHAGEIETSTSLATRPELVRMEHVEKLVPNFSSRYLNFSSTRAVSWHAFTKRLSKSGVMGDPTKASAEKGRRMWDIMIKHLVIFVEELKQLTLDEIFQRRY